MLIRVLLIVFATTGTAFSQSYGEWVIKTDVEMQTTKVKCNKVKSATDGTTKTCFYNCGGKTRTIAVPDRKACPVIR